jgi:regulatory protein
VPPLRSKPAGRGALAEGEPPLRRADGPTPAALKSRALRWLAQRDHSRAELERKLLAHARALARLAEQAAAEAARAAPGSGDANEGAPPADEPAFPDSLLRPRIAAVVDSLAAAGLMNEPRMAESLVAAKAPRFGERRLRQVMQQRGLQPALVDAAVQQAREQAGGSELERARGLWERRFGAPAATPSEQARQMRFLAGRGFGGEVIRRVLRDTRDAAASAAETPPDDEPA